MRIAELLPEENVVLSLRVGDKSQLLQELAQRAGAALNVPQRQILAALQARENLGSTGLGQGFALPHARVEGLDRLFGLFIRLTRPIAYDAVDEKPVDLVFLLLIPAEAGSEPIPVMAAISRCIRDQDLARQVRKVRSAMALRALLTG